MACDSTYQPISMIIEDALLIAGKASNSGVSSGVWVDRAKYCLNLIVAEWSGTDLYNFYINTFTFAAFGNKLEYSIGVGRDLETQPFNTITSMYYTYSGSNIPILYEPMQSFNRGTYQIASGTPGIYTYNNQEGVTYLKLLPRPFDGLEITINGKQHLGEVSLFDSNVMIPQYAVSALTYQLANELFARGAGVPNANFQTTLGYHLSVLKKVSKQDRQIEVKKTSQNVGAGRGWGWLGGSGGWSNGGW
jgi:hypothetical protein